VANSVIATQVVNAPPPTLDLDAEVLAAAGPAGQDIYRERVQITGAILAEIARVLATQIVGTEYALATRNIPTFYGTQGNAWTAVAVAAGGVSASIDTQLAPNISIFGNTSGGTTITVQFSQDNVNFYDALSTVATGDFAISATIGARYIRLNNSVARTITATIAAKG
jgi:hypothetical protein